MAKNAAHMRQIGPSLGIRPGERAMVLWVTSLFAVCLAAISLVLNSADTLFFLRFGVEFLPRLILASGPIVMIVILAYAAGLGRWGPARWSPITLAALGVLLVAERAGVATEAPGIYPIVWLAGQASVMVTLTAVWNIAGEVCDTRQAKRLFPILASAGIAGGIIGNVSTGPLASAIGTENLLLAAAGLLGIAAWLAAGVARRFFSQTEEQHDPLLTSLRVGLEVTFNSRMMRLVAFLGLALNVLFFLVVFPFSGAVASSFATEPEVAGFLGYFSSLATAATFVVSLLLASRVVARFGVVGTLSIVPVVYLLGFVAWTIEFDLTTASVVRGAQWVVINAFGAAAWGALFNVLPRRQRGKVMAFVTAVPVQVGTVLSGMVLIAGAQLEQTPRFAIGAALASVTCLIVWLMRSAYVQALLDAVKGGFVEVFTPAGAGVHPVVVGGEALDAIRGALADEAAEARVMAVAMLGSVEEAPATRALLVSATRDEDPLVRATAVEALGRQDGEVSDVIAAAQADPTPTVRLAALRLIQRRNTPDEVSPALLEDPEPSVRGAAAALIGDHDIIGSLIESGDEPEQLAGLEALIVFPEHRFDLSRFFDNQNRRIRAAAGAAMSARNPEAVVPLLDDPSLTTRRLVAHHLAATEAGRIALREVLETGSVRATDASVSALAATPADKDHLVEWVDHEADRVAFLRRSRESLAKADTDRPEAGFLTRILEMREKTLARWAAIALTSMASPGIVDTVMRGISSNETELRSQAMEALETVADRHVARKLLGIMEEDEHVSDEASLDDTLQRLAEDFDPWIRAAASRWLEAAPAAGEVVQGLPGPEMHETQALNPMECVIALNRVPMFADLDPEDTERLAAVTSQRRYEADEVIYREGSRGDEMLIVLQGGAVASGVRGGKVRVFREFGPGDHVGELALLRGQPRVSDVVAGPRGAVALALRKREFEAILEERPEVALTMLGTLADRIAAG